MKQCTVYLRDADYELLGEIFKNEPNFQPKCKQDYLIYTLLKQIHQNSEDHVEGAQEE